MILEQVMTMFDDKHYACLSSGYADDYRNNDPFPHISFDHFLPYEVAYRLAKVYPNKTNEGWTVHSNERADRKFLGNETKVDPLFRCFMQATASRQFLLFLETLTGIGGLIPDPYYLGGGAMTAGRGDKLDMHIDFNWNYKLHVHRRVNALFYLTPDWQEEWGGALRVQDGQDGPYMEYLPFFNRMVVFSTTEHSWHGQPEPISCPAGALRQVFSAFYYTAASDEQIADPHLTKYHSTTPYTEKPMKEYHDATV